MIIDCDVHIYTNAKCPLDPFIPDKYQVAFEFRQASAPWHGYSNPFGVNRRDIPTANTAEELIQLHLEPNNITYAVLQPTEALRAGLMHNIDLGNVYAQAMNDWLVANFLAHDPRMLGSIVVNMQDPAVAAAEIRRLGNHPQMVQALVGGDSIHLYGHRSYFPVYEACCEMGLVFAVHPGTEGSFHSGTPIGRPSSYFEWHNALPLTYQAHLGSMVAEGVFEHFPQLKVLLVEGGISWLAPLLWRMDKNYKALRSTVPWLKELPSDYVLRHCRLSTQPIEEPDQPEYLLQMYRMVQAERTVCFSSDFPHWDFDDPCQAFPSRIPAELRDRILYDNAAELFGLPARTAKEVRA